MDPDKAWDLLVKAATDFQTLDEDNTFEARDKQALAASDMADLVLALNNWAKSGGFPPKPFRKPASEL